MFELVDRRKLLVKNYYGLCEGLIIKRNKIILNDK